MEITQKASESLAPWIPSSVQAHGTLVPEAAERVRLWWERAQQVYPANTRKAWRCDWAVFYAFCVPAGLSPLPASSDTVAAFVTHCREAGRKPATVRRYLSTIAVAHRVAKLVNPIQDEAVSLELRRLDQAVSVRQRQAK